MVIEEQQLKTFITLYRKEYGIELTDEQAREEALKLLRLYMLVYLGKQ